jgi:hypothetical protein
MENTLEKELARRMRCMFSERKTTRICTENTLENELGRRIGCMLSERKTTRICAVFFSQGN